MSPPASEETVSLPSPELFSLVNQTALITGGSRGIGASIALALAEAGAAVCIAQRDVANTSTRDAIRAKGHKADIVYCDLRDVVSVKGVFGGALEVLGGRIDILVNCGGLLKRSDSTKISEADWDEVSPSMPPVLFLDDSLFYHEKS